MKNKLSPQMLGLIIVLMITFIIVQLNIFNFFKSSNIVEVKTEKQFYGLIPRQETEAAMYDRLHDKDSNIPLASKRKSTKRASTHYNNRAFAGAPPRIPHPVSDLLQNGSFENCLQCHQNGSYAIDMQAYAPIVPHPTFVNCRQCHVPKRTSKLFKDTNWKNVFKVVEGRRHLPGSPPVIPHSLQLRENCLSCHLGNGAMEEIKVSHPERTNCRQCHVESNTLEFFSRSTTNESL